MSFDHDAAAELREMGVDIGRLTTTYTRTFYEDSWQETSADCEYILKLLKDKQDYILKLEGWIINSTKKRPSTALDFLDEKAEEIIRRRKSKGV